MMMSQKEIPEKYECERYKLTTQDKEFCHKRKNVSAEGCYECDGLVEPIKELKENKDNMDIVLCKECQQESVWIRGLCKKCYQRQWAKNKKLKANYVCIESDCPNLVSQKDRRCKFCASKKKAKNSIAAKSVKDPIETKSQDPIIEVDFTNYLEIYIALQKDAIACFRTVEKQILALIAESYDCYYYVESEWRDGIYQKKPKED